MGQAKISNSEQTEDRIDKHFFIRNRRRLVEKMVVNSVAILGGNYPLYTNGDGVLPYVSNHDLWYFTGIDQDQTLLMLVKSGKRQHEELIFILPRDPAIEVWDGERLSPEKTTAISGIADVHTTSEWEAVFKGKVLDRDTLYLNIQEHPRAPLYRNRNHDLYDYCRKHFPLHHYGRLAPLIHSLRIVKHPLEVAEIRRAINVSRQALERIFPFIEEGYCEKDIEAEMIAIYTRHGGPAFPPIVASGKNSCTLHYISNRDKLTAGEVVLIDSGSRGGYTGKYPADITRVFPIRQNKISKIKEKKSSLEKSSLREFTPRQREVYEAVLRVLEQASALVKPGVKFRDYQKKSLQFMKRELLGLGLLKKKELDDPNAHRKYFMHGISHWLGLDVHDVGSYAGEFVEGMVLTCEPGIYIPQEGLGVRLENNLWIRSSKTTENLSSSIPLEVEDVYRWLEKHS